METHKREESRSKWDRVWVGLLVALVVPFIVMVLYWYALLSSQMSFGSMFTDIGAQGIMKVISLCASPDLLVFWWFNKKNWTSASKGMVLAIIIMLIYTVIVKL
ncbi:MAG: hypothetical protein MJZ66_07915 [Bacteroidales bacterium]|nr:hypothetical protein [Bacteroidales bacterium]